jgi:hypothetical protein
MAVAARPGEQVQARRRLRKLQGALRDGLAAAAVLERAATLEDVWGRYTLVPGEPVDVSDLAAWLAVAQAENPGQPMELLLVAPQHT